MCAKVKRLESIISVLKSVECTVSSPQKERLREMERLQGQFSSRVLCDALEVPRGTYLNHIKRNKKDADSYHERREMLKKRISAIHDAARQIYGAAKIAAKLKEEDIRVSKEMVGARGFEPPTFCSQSRRTTRLCNAPNERLKG